MRIEPSKEYVTNVLDKYKRNTTVDFSTGELKYDDVPIIWARSELMYHIYSELENLMSESALSILKRISKPYGANFYIMMKEQSLAKRLNTHENIYKYLVSETMAIGWGEVIMDIEGDTITCTSEKGLPVGKYHKELGKTSTYPIDSYFLGYLEGFLGEMHNKIYIGVEEECVGKGDERCVMTFTV
ncbi:MAG: 4-vinyl reductase [Thermoplasmata archaeon]|nr:4-vinyl reductase [Thermoplasmata archaeon]